MHRVPARRAPVLLALLGAALLALVSGASAQPGTVLTSFSPATVGNGRGVALDPATGTLYYTNSGDPNIYATTTAGGPDLFVVSPVDAAGAPINYGALSWDAKRGVLWGGRYVPNAGVPGGVDTIPPLAGVQAVSPQFAFAFPPGESCYLSPPGFIDGLAYDEGPTPGNADDRIWLSDDAATVVHQVDLTGASIGSFAAPPGRCNTGIAADGEFLWLALQSGPDTPPHDIVRVAKSNPTVVLSSFLFNAANPGPEDIELDLATFAPDACALWSNQFGPTVLTAWELEQGIKPECAVPTRIDIKPGSFPNSIKLSNKGVIPVALLGSADFDVTDVDYSTVCFAGDCSEAHGTVHFGDVNGDGFLDAVLHYQTQETNIVFGDTEACLTGQLTDGTFFEGCDSVRTLDP
jgi:hypothetical protein